MPGSFCLLFTLTALTGTAWGQITASGYNGVTASFSASGAWSVSVPAQRWLFAGSLGASAASHMDSGNDNLGSYQEIAFSYSISGNARAASIRLYAARPVVMFFAIYNTASANQAPFPTISSYPAMSHLSFNGEFAEPDFVNLNNDGPWAFFDPSYNTWILSPASNYMTASNAVASNGNITAGIAAGIGSLPAGFTHTTALVFGQGINNTFGIWGQALTDLARKKRPTNDADPLLKNVSYWTDNGATYYYNPGPTSYMSTLDSIREEFDSVGVKLGSLQLDSWWYPKGPDNSWSSHNGIWTYTASLALFVPDLATFQAGLKVPLITHARWIDAASPYRGQYTISGNVATDPQYWEDIASYLKASGTTVYEQDWLGDNAQSNFNLTDHYAFLGNMAASMAKRSIDIQYCMALPKHFLQSTNYSNVTSIRTSQDRFGADRWTSFFYSSRLASAIGVWPYSDVFMSTETNNMIAALLSGGPLGVGDAVGSISKTNMLKAVRPDGAIVKPDMAATPIDSVFLSDAQGIDVPMIAAAATDFGGGMRANYLFAYTRGANNTVVVDPSAFGISGASVLYDELGANAVFLSAGQTYTFNLTKAAGYYVLVPVGASGIAFLGDRHQFVTLGKRRIASVADTGLVDVEVSFAAGEDSRTLFGYSPQPVVVASLAGNHHAPVWDSNSEMFTVVVTPDASGVAHVQMSSAITILAGPAGLCGIRCGK
jgi:hypothetical protein